MSAKIDITGQRLYKLTAIRPTLKRYRGNVIWLCRCDCGNMCEVTANRLRSGNTKSCGCLQPEVVALLNLTHGESRVGKQTGAYRSWAYMKSRCLNPNDTCYHNYGGRGIKVCDRWLEFENFLEDMGERPEGLTLDRIDNDGNYEKNNCRWVDWNEQANNRRPDIRCKWFRAIEQKTRSEYRHYNQREFARQHGLSSLCIVHCLAGRNKTHKGWTFEYMEV